jgi:hypothetical protein
MSQSWLVQIHHHHEHHMHLEFSLETKVWRNWTLHVLADLSSITTERAARTFAQTDSCQSTSCTNGSSDRKDGPSVVEHLWSTCAPQVSPPVASSWSSQPATQQLTPLNLTLPLSSSFSLTTLLTHSSKQKEQGKEKGEGLEAATTSKQAWTSCRICYPQEVAVEEGGALSSLPFGVRKRWS